ncbi:MAG: UbiA-like protein EboC [Chitinophagaceae bacterium]|nr:UbiA-like protein EboC [Chitinophagaceae bacterium]
MNRFIGYLRLTRLANIVTAVSDILAGAAIAGSLISVIDFNGEHPGRSFISQPGIVHQILFLMFATACLYGGGVVLNDVFDAELDKTERPERPIPSGLISKNAASIFGSLLLLAGIIAAWLSDPVHVFSLSAWLATSIALASVIYDKWGKHNNLLGPLNMGLCRALNLLLGMSVSAYAVYVYWPLALVPMVYIAAITMISRGEVHGGKKTTLYAAAFLYLLVISAIIYFAFISRNLLVTLPFLIIFSILIFPSLKKAIHKPEGPRIGKAVKSGVIALIAMNASWAAASGEIYFAILILLLLPLSLFLARLFAVT